MYPRSEGSLSVPVFLFRVELKKHVDLMILYLYKFVNNENGIHTSNLSVKSNNLDCGDGNNISTEKKNICPFKVDFQIHISYLVMKIVL